MRLKLAPVFILVTILSLVAVFQNCTQAVPYGTVDYYQSLVDSPNFPYEVKVDQLAYLSCSEQEDIANDGTFFTFRVGAFQNGGIRIHSTFRDGVKKVDDDEVPFALQNSQSSSGAYLQLAMRSTDNLQYLYRDDENGDDGVQGYDYYNFFPAMGDTALSTMLWYLDEAEYLKTYTPGLTTADYRFQGELQFMKSNVMESDVRNFFVAKRGVLAVTFAPLGEVTPLGPGSLEDLQDLAGVSADSAPNNNLATNVYGAAIKPYFKQPSGTFGIENANNPGSDLGRRVLSSVSDITIDERLAGVSQSPWVCDIDMQFMVVLPEDVTYYDDDDVLQDRCLITPDPIDASDADAQKLKLLRQSFYSSDWYIDLDNRCIIPKTDHVIAGSCYGVNSSTQDTHQINYDTFATDGCGLNSEYGLCPHFASICYRQ